MEHYQSWIKSYYAAGNEIIYRKELLLSNLCNYNDGYILVRDNITLKGVNRSEVIFKNYSLSALQKAIE